MTYHPPIGHSWRSVGHNQMIVTSTAKTLTNGATYIIPESTQLVRVQPDNGSIRWRADGTSPTANTGNLITTQVIEYISGVIGSIELIRKNAANVTVSLDFQGYKN